MDLTRRGFGLGLGAAFGSLAASGPASAMNLRDVFRALAPRDDVILSAVPAHKLADAVTVMTGQNDILLLADTDHTQSSIRKLITGSFIGAFRQGGGEQLLLEWPARLQPYVDNFMQGDMRREQRAMFVSNLCNNASLINEGADRKAEVFGEVADMLVAAKKNGIAVRFIDNSKGLNDADFMSPDEIKQVENIAKRAMADYRATGKPEPRNDRQAGEFQRYYRAWARENLTRAERAQADEIVQRFLVVRTDDRDVARDIEQASRGRKTMVVYGARHIAPMHSWGLDEQLGRTVKVAQIALYDRLDQKASMESHYGRSFGDLATRLPDAMVDARRGLLYLTAQGRSKYESALEGSELAPARERTSTTQAHQARAPGR